jgi:G:T-mismatch repair DNA endonuclease (very short patch repair protein)
MMARVRASDTDLELAVRRALFGLVLQGWRCHRRDLPGPLTWRLAELALPSSSTALSGTGILTG